MRTIHIEIVEILNRLGMEYFVEKEDTQISHIDYFDSVLGKDKYESTIDLQTFLPACLWFYNSVSNLDLEVKGEDLLPLQKLADYSILTRDGLEIWIYKAA